MLVHEMTNLYPCKKQCYF